MENVIDITSKQSFSQLAIDKLNAELKAFSGDRYASAVKNHVASTLIHFCRENSRFAEVVYKTKRTLSDCCQEIMKGCGSSISDIDVYRGAVKAYFPNSDIEFVMNIKITGEAPTAEEMARKPVKGKDSTVIKKAAPSKPEKPVAPKAAKATSEPAKKPEAKAARKAPKKKEPELDVIQISLF